MTKPPPSPKPEPPDAKTCRKCGVLKPPSSYYMDNRSGLPLVVCKACVVARTNAWQRNNPEAMQAIRRRSDANRAEDRARYASRRLRERRTELREKIRDYRAEDPERYRAHTLLNSAVRRGRIVKPKACADCGRRKRLDGHHDDYSKPFMVRWLCVSCHRLTHRTKEAAHG